MDIRTGTILEAEKMPKNKKLLILKVDTGIDVRTIVSGIAESLNQKICWKRVTVLVNGSETFVAWKSRNDFDDYEC
jgi:methionyl-tRNA synthetase